MDDDKHDARAEAVLGLARRRDPRVLPVILARLQEDGVGKLAVEAATYLGDAQLLSPGVARTSAYDPHRTQAATRTGMDHRPQAAKLLGLQLNSVHHLIDRGELAAEVVRADDWPKRRRSIRIRRQAVDDYLERARVKPGELCHLHPNWSSERYG